MIYKRKVYFRVDADKTIGFGHFFRCLALANILKNDFDCVFFIQSPTTFQINEIEKVCKLVVLPIGDAKFQVFLDHLSGAEIVVLDNYFFTSFYQRQIKEKGCKLVCFGTNDRHYYADLLLNFAEEDAQIFSVEPYTKIKLGLDWVILREPFRNIRICNHQRKGFVICFGGTDQFFLTEKFVDYLQCKDRNVSIHVLATESFGIERLKKLEQCGVSPHLNASAIEVAHVLVESSCLIASASTITCEALACQTPIMCGYYVDNQRKMYDSLMRKRYVHGLGDLLDVSSIFLLECALKELNSKGNSLKKIQFNDLPDRYINLFQSL